MMIAMGRLLNWGDDIMFYSFTCYITHHAVQIQKAVTADFNPYSSELICKKTSQTKSFFTLKSS